MHKSTVWIGMLYFQKVPEEDHISDYDLLALARIALATPGLVLNSYIEVYQTT